ncbi:amino acid ABC transporter permease [Clostridium sp. BJN0001]|uniref:amino acid ABC transporter permease n=1 Tax=Clostridium sp. BJN0001 TaxID=2930219 RepID=UPI001FD2CCE1|nr:amino acid ABC transporter permease [Clostridium sp. BJN0001]
MSQLFEIAVTYKAILIEGFKITILMSVLTIIFGFIFGIVMTFMKISKFKLLNIIANIYVEIIRGTPVLVQIAIIFYGLPMMGIRVPEIRFGDVDISRVVSGVIALTINTAAYICEIIRSGIESIDKGQMEASRSIGFSASSSMILIILPQAIKNILPAMGNEFITIIKTTSQVSIIGVSELMYAADTIRGTSFRPMEPLIIIAVIYFVITFTISIFIKLLERRMGKSTR